MNNGGPVFPINYQFERNDGSIEIQRWEGMSLRDYLFGKVLQGFCANPTVFAQNGMTGWALVNCNEETLVKYALSIADTALAERSK